MHKQSEEIISTSIFDQKHSRDIINYYLIGSSQNSTAVCMHTLLVYKICPKSIETEALFANTEINSKWNVIFFNIVLLAFSTFIPVSFTLVKASQKYLFWCDVKLYRIISFNILHILKSLTLELKFQFRK